MLTLSNSSADCIYPRQVIKLEWWMWYLEPNSASNTPDLTKMMAKSLYTCTDEVQTIPRYRRQGDHAYSQRDIRNKMPNKGNPKFKHNSLTFYAAVHAAVEKIDIRFSTYFW